MRQRRDFRRHAMLLEDPDDVRLPSGRPNQALVESIRLSQLEAYPVDRIEKLRRRRLLAERMQDAPLVRRQRPSSRAGGKAPQQRRIVRFGAGDPTFALRGRGGRVESQDLIDQPRFQSSCSRPWSVVTSV